MGVGRILNFIIFSVFADFVLGTGTTVHQADFNPDDLSYEHLCIKHLEPAGSVLDCCLGEFSVLAIGRAFKVAMGYPRQEAPRTPSWEFRIFVGCCLQKDLVERITLRLNPHHKGLQTLDKLIFSTFVWLIWCERNWSIFRMQTKSAINLVHIIINTIRSRILYLGINLPDDIFSYWNAPPSDHHSNVVRAVCPGWRFSIYSAGNTIVGIVWSDICQPMYAAIESSLDYYMVVMQVIQIIPNLVTQVCIEAYSDLIQALRCPSKSPWTVRFQVRKLVSSNSGLKVSNSLICTLKRFSSAKRFPETEWVLFAYQYP